MMSPYNVTKAGVVALSETLYGELHKTGVHVTALCPTFFRTNIAANGRKFGEDIDERADTLVSESKWSAEEIADIALADLERGGRLYSIPQRDGRILWRAQRLLTDRFYGLLGAMAANETTRKWFGRQ